MLLALLKSMRDKSFYTLSTNTYNGQNDKTNFFYNIFSLYNNN